MTELRALAQALLAMNREAGKASSAGRLDQLRRMAPIALALGAELNRDLRRFAELSVQVGVSELAECLLDLPLSLANAQQTEPALAVALSFEFLAPDKLRGDRS